MKQNDIYKNVAEELDIPYDKVLYVITTFEKSMRWFMSNPVYGGTNLFFVNLFRFQLRDRYLKKKIIKYANKNPETRTVKYYTYVIRKFFDKDFLKDLVDVEHPID